jgi:hypothetical protein
LFRKLSFIIPSGNTKKMGGEKDEQKRSC